MPTTPWTPGPAAEPSPTEIVVLASELRLRSLRHVPGFMRAAMRILKQVRQSPCAVGVSLRAAPLRRTFWTLSSWESREAIDAFVGTDPHRRLMAAMRPVMAGSLFTTWEQVGGPSPAWTEAERRLDRQRRGTP